MKIHNLKVSISLQAEGTELDGFYGLAHAINELKRAPSQQHRLFEIHGISMDAPEFYALLYDAITYQLPLKFKFSIGEYTSDWTTDLKELFNVLMDADPQVLSKLGITVTLYLDGYLKQDLIYAILTQHPDPWKYVKYEMYMAIQREIEKEREEEEGEGEQEQEEQEEQKEQKE